MEKSLPVSLESRTKSHTESKYNKKGNVKTIVTRTYRWENDNDEDQYSNLLLHKQIYILSCKKEKEKYCQV